MNDKGFSLFEMVVAFAILAVALSVIYQAFGMGLNRRSIDALNVSAVQLAQEKLERVGFDIPLKEGRRDGQNGELTWQLEIKKVVGGNPDQQRWTLYDVALTVLSSDRILHHVDTRKMAYEDGL